MPIRFSRPQPDLITFGRLRMILGGMESTTAQRHIKNGDLPPPCHIMANTRYWRRKDIEGFRDGVVRKIDGEWVRTAPPVRDLTEETPERHTA